MENLFNVMIDGLHIPNDMKSAVIAIRKNCLECALVDENDYEEHQDNYSSLISGDTDNKTRSVDTAFNRGWNINSEKRAAKATAENNSDSIKETGRKLSELITKHYQVASNGTSLQDYLYNLKNYHNSMAKILNDKFNTKFFQAFSNLHSVEILFTLFADAIETVIGKEVRNVDDRVIATIIGTYNEIAGLSDNTANDIMATVEDEEADGYEDPSDVSLDANVIDMASSKLKKKLKRMTSAMKVLGYNDDAETVMENPALSTNHTDVYLLNDLPDSVLISIVETILEQYSELLAGGCEPDTQLIKSFSSAINDISSKSKSYRDRMKELKSAAINRVINKPMQIHKDVNNAALAVKEKSLDDEWE